MLLLSAVLLLVSAGCRAEPETSKQGKNQAPAISVTAEEITIPSTYGLNQWDGSVYDREDTFLSLMSPVQDIKDLPNIRLHQTIRIELDGAAPDSYTLTDQILTKEGKLRYGNAATQDVPITFSGSHCEFELLPNYAASLSSNVKDYEPGATIRGFRLTCSWGDNECEYAFVLRTNAF